MTTIYERFMRCRYEASVIDHFLYMAEMSQNDYVELLSDVKLGHKDIEHLDSGVKIYGTTIYNDWTCYTGQPKWYMRKK